MQVNLANDNQYQIVVLIHLRPPKRYGGVSVPYTIQPAAEVPARMNTRLTGMSAKPSDTSRTRRARSKPTRSNRPMPSRHVSRHSSARHPASINVRTSAAMAQHHAMEPATLAGRRRPRQRLALPRHKLRAQTALVPGRARSALPPPAAEGGPRGNSHP